MMPTTHPHWATPGAGGVNQPAAALLSFSGGLTLLIVLNLVDCCAGRICGRAQSKAPCGRPRRWYEVMGGVLGSTIMLLIILSTPVVGLALLSVMRVCGNVTVATLFDHVGCLGLPVRKLDFKKVRHRSPPPPPPPVPPPSAPPHTPLPTPLHSAAAWWCSSRECCWACWRTYATTRLGR